MIALNLGLVVLVLLPVYVVIAALLAVVLGPTVPGGAGPQSFIESVRQHARDRWWVPLLYLFVAPFVSALLVWLAHRRTTVSLRVIALVAAPAGYLALFLFLFGRSASLEAVARAAIPGVLATVAYAAVIRLPRSVAPPSHERSTG